MFSPGHPWDIGPYSCQLLALSSIAWTPHEIRMACVMNGWPVEPLRWNPGLRARLDDRLNLFVGYGTGERPPQGVATVYYHEEGNYWRTEEFDDFGHVDFDQAFQITRDTLVSRLGRPEVEGVHAIGWLKGCRYRFGIWRAVRGLLVLQQGELDLQCGGVDVSICLHPWEESRPTPPVPLLVNGAA